MPGASWAIGLMSGTSMDGVDAALIESDGARVLAFGPSLTLTYGDEMRAALRSVMGGAGPVAEVAQKLTHLHAEAVNALLARAGLTANQVRVAGFHGQTILHRPEERWTWQIGDGALLARLIGIPVVNDFRSQDVAEGGQGAPLVPLFHAALAGDLAKPLAVLNLGGVGNLTFLGRSGDPLAFDTGPGNALLDDWALLHTGKPVDEGGRLAAKGRVDIEALEAFARHGYFRQAPPKSLDRDDFRAFAQSLIARMDAPTGAATLAAFTARAAALGRAHFPEAPRRWLVCGGGRRNPSLMAALARELAPAPVEPVETVGWDGDALEAQAFAFLALRSLQGLPLTLPTTTGAPRPLTGGTLHRP